MKSASAKGTHLKHSGLHKHLIPLPSALACNAPAWTRSGWLQNRERGSRGIFALHMGYGAPCDRLFMSLLQEGKAFVALGVCRYFSFVLLPRSLQNSHDSA